jgi:lipopolysaccharide transport system ATP-binding protein
VGEIVVRAEGLSKQFTLGERWRHDTLRDHLVRTFSPRRQGPRRARTFWALRGVSFEVRRGEMIGIVGPNGAGKSTLLKILSRITEPTSGFAEIQGRVGTLLDVGAGFHPELTGRDNIYLNGAIMGMKKSEIDRKRDDIVAFAGVEQFIDTPVKRYSTGMYLRLAFAVAAHLDQEILVVDEVLAVGDAEFQRRCLGKMGSVSREGRTVLLVSHNLGAITQFCERTLWIDGGRLKLDGASADVVASYLASSFATGAHRLDATDGDGRKFRFTSVRILSAHETPIPVVEFQSASKIEIAYEVRAPLRNLSIICRVTDGQGTIVWTSWDTDSKDWRGSGVREAGQYMSACIVPPYLLRPGVYHVDIGAAASAAGLPFQENVLSFEVSEVGYRMNRGRRGVITPVLQWETSRIGDAAADLPVRDVSVLDGRHNSALRS